MYLFWLLHFYCREGGCFLKKLLVYIIDFRLECVLAPLFKLLEASFELIVPLIMAAIIDKGIPTGDTGFIVRMCLWLVALGAGLFLLRQSPQLAATLSTALLVGGGDVTATAQGRVELWSRALYLMQDFPFTGVGLGMPQRVIDLLYPLFTVVSGSQWLHVHNTYLQIGSEMGIITDDARSAVTGAEVEAATNKQLRKLVESTDVFARTSPEHKLRLVQALQANGEIVAMTGDGVNDAPALKQADVGVAMGIKGTEATKEAADIVLADDNFVTIECAIEEGRRINDNLHKSVLFLLPTNGAQSLVVLSAVLFGWTLPLAPVQILWVNMVTAITLSLALAYEPAEPDIMLRPPRRPDAPLLNAKYLPRIAVASLLIAAATLITFTLGRMLTGDLASAQTWAVNTLALGQAAYLFNARFLRESSLRREAIGGNPMVWRVVGLLVILQLGFVYLPVMNAWFGSAALGVLGWAIPLSFAVVIFALMEVGKALLRVRETG